MEGERPDKQKRVTIWDDTGKELTLLPAQKVAIVTSDTSVPKKEHHKSIFFELAVATCRCPRPTGFNSRIAWRKGN